MSRNSHWAGSSDYVIHEATKGRPKIRKVGAANSKKTKATNRQKPKRRKR